MRSGTGAGSARPAPPTSSRAAHGRTRSSSRSTASSDELLNVEAFETLLEAQVLAEDFRIDYNTYRPHSALGQLTPAEFAERWARQEAGLSLGVDS